MRQWQYQELYSKKIEADIPLYITDGKHKGCFCVLYKDNVVYGPKIEVNLGPDAVSVHYRDLERLGEDGEPAPEPILDMTGRELEQGNWIVYSVSSGRSSHALELAEIVEISKTGTLTVKRTIRNGDKVALRSWDKETRKVSDPDRCIKLPVDRTTLTKWVLMDFEEMG